LDKTSGGNGIPGELFQIQKDAAAKVLHSIYQQMKKKNASVATRQEKVSFRSNSKEGQSQRMFKLL